MRARRAERLVTVYRVVDAIELAYLRATGNYGSNPNRSGKYFALTLTGAEAFAGAPMIAPATITSTTLPQSVIDSGFGFVDAGRLGAGPSVFFAEAQLPGVYARMTPPALVAGTGS
jgi:hypothetical protein